MRASATTSEATVISERRLTAAPVKAVREALAVLTKRLLVEELPKIAADDARVTVAAVLVAPDGTEVEVFLGLDFAPDPFEEDEDREAAGGLH
jgi:hypothetical protein